MCCNPSHSGVRFKHHWTVKTSFYGRTNVSWESCKFTKRNLHLRFYWALLISTGVSVFPRPSRRAILWHPSKVHFPNDCVRKLLDFLLERTIAASKNCTPGSFESAHLATTPNSTLIEKEIHSNLWHQWIYKGRLYSAPIAPKRMTNYYKLSFTILIKVQFLGKCDITSLKMYVEDVSSDSSQIWWILFFLWSTLIF